jgi:ribosomal protein L10
VKQLTELRRSLGGAKYTVAKNTLAKRAAANAGLAGLDDLFTGPTALAFVSGDVVEAAKGFASSRRPTRSSSSKAVFSRARRLARPRSRSSPTSSPARFCWPSWPVA